MHKIISLICAAVICITGVAVVAAYHHDQAQVYIKQAEAKASQLAQAAKDKLRQEAQAAVIAREKAQIKAECDKEESYYASLSSAQKSKAAAPNCRSLQMVE